ncbi:MAG TPA: hypothetical protein PKI83_04390, partial [Bacteroidales bacterium]|nr:hypothetical protein [Bacteroidales bacterium]
MNVGAAVMGLGYIVGLKYSAIIAAGSLLDFAIKSVGVPVGRVYFLYVYPLSFFEFLCATGHSTLAHALVDGVCKES